MPVTDRRIAIIGTVASILGLAVAIPGLFTGYPIVLLASLVVLEAAGIAIWVYYNRQRSRLQFPHSREYTLALARYVFETKNKMTYESIYVYKVTEPALQNLSLPFTWTGKGNIRITSDFHKDLLDYTLDDKTGTIRVKYPIPTYRFGDTFPIHIRMALDDTSSQNIPELCCTIHFPTQLCVLEVVLKHKTTNSSAWLGCRPDISDHLVSFQNLKEIEFEEETRSYRAYIPNPLLNQEYRLKWDA